MWWPFRRERHNHPLPNDTLFDTVIDALTEVLEGQEQFMADLARLQAAVDANTQAVADVAALVAAIPAPVAPSTTDQTAIDDLAGKVEANNTALGGIKAPA